MTENVRKILRPTVGKLAGSLIRPCRVRLSTEGGWVGGNALVIWFAIYFTTAVDLQCTRWLVRSLHLSITQHNPTDRPAHTKQKPGAEPAVLHAREGEEHASQGANAVRRGGGLLRLWTFQDPPPAHAQDGLRHDAAPLPHAPGVRDDRERRGPNRVRVEGARGI